MNFPNKIKLNEIRYFKTCDTNLRTAGCLPSLRKLGGQIGNPPTVKPPADLPDPPAASPKSKINI